MTRIVRKTSIPPLGDVAVGTAPWRAISEALKLAREAEERQKADVFSNFLLSSMLLEPEMSPEEIARLSPEAALALVDVAVDQLSVRKYFERTSSSALPRQRLYTAFSEYWRESLKPLAESIVLGVNAYRYAVSSIGWDVLEDTAQLFDRLSVRWLDPQIPRFDIPVIDPSRWTAALDVSRQIAASLESVVDIYGRIGSQLTTEVENLLSGYDSVFQHVSANLAALQLAARKLYSLDVFRDLVRLSDAAEAFKEARWPLSPSMPAGLRERVVELHQQGKGRYISNAIMGYYRRHNHEHLVAAVDAWESNPFFAPRMHIIRDALWVHCEGRYTLSVPALVPLFEGILSDYVRKHELPAKLGQIKAVYEAAIGDPDDYGFLEWAITTTLLYLFQTNTYTWTDFSGELEKSVERREVSRHTVAHGITYKYDRPIHSLKAFLILDAISALQPPT